jgi:hypothetical protein
MRRRGDEVQAIRSAPVDAKRTAVPEEATVRSHDSVDGLDPSGQFGSVQFGDLHVGDLAGELGARTIARTVGAGDEVVAAGDDGGVALDGVADVGLSADGRRLAVGELVLGVDGRCLRSLLEADIPLGGSGGGHRVHAPGAPRVTTRLRSFCQRRRGCGCRTGVVE